MKYQIVTFEKRNDNYVNRVNTYRDFISSARHIVRVKLNRDRIDERMIVKGLPNLGSVALGEGWVEKEVYATWKKNETGEYFLVVAIFENKDCK